MDFMPVGVQWGERRKRDFLPYIYVPTIERKKYTSTLRKLRKKRGKCLRVFENRRLFCIVTVVRVMVVRVKHFHAELNNGKIPQRSGLAD
jgi:hypothetical protein